MAAPTIVPYAFLRHSLAAAALVPSRSDESWTFPVPRTIGNRKTWPFKIV